MAVCRFEFEASQAQAAPPGEGGVWELREYREAGARREATRGGDGDDAPAHLLLFCVRRRDSQGAHHSLGDTESASRALTPLRAAAPATPEAQAPDAAEEALAQVMLGETLECSDDDES